MTHTKKGSSRLAPKTETSRCLREAQEDGLSKKLTKLEAFFSSSKRDYPKSLEFRHLPPPPSLRHSLYKACLESSHL